MYDTSGNIHGQRIQEELLKFKDPIINIVVTGGVTRSGRIFVYAPPSVGLRNPSNLDKGKQIDDTQQRQSHAPSDEVKELLCIIKKRDYLVVEQLNQMT